MTIDTAIQSMLALMVGWLIASVQKLKREMKETREHQRERERMIEDDIAALARSVMKPADDPIHGAGKGWGR